MDPILALYLFLMNLFIGFFSFWLEVRETELLEDFAYISVYVETSKLPTWIGRESNSYILFSNVFIRLWVLKYGLNR